MASQKAGPSTSSVNGAGIGSGSTKMVDVNGSNMVEPVQYCRGQPSTGLDGAAIQSIMEHCIAQVVKAEGYDGIEASAMHYILDSTEAVMAGLMDHIHELAMVARRRQPSIRDGWEALQEGGSRMAPKTLRQYAKSRKVEPLSQWPIGEAASVERLDEWMAPEASWLPSEEEEGDLNASQSEDTKRRRRKRFRPAMDEIPPHLPPLPPKHCWLATPSYPLRSEDLVDPLTLIDIKTSSTRLTEASLRGLIRATDSAAFSSHHTKEEQLTETPPPIKAETSTDPAAAKATLAADEPPTPSSSRPQRANAGRRSSSMADNPHGYAVPPTAASALHASVSSQSAVSPIDEPKQRKNRAISLRLRTASSPHAVGDTSDDRSMSAVDMAMAPPPPHNVASRRPSAAHRASLSLSLGAPRSAVFPLASPATAFSPLHRRTATTPSAAPWSAFPSNQASYFTWGPPTPSLAQATPGGLELKPLATPLTPGAGFAYPATPLDLYSGADASGAYEGIADDLDGGEITLPGVVNYKRSWYRKGHAVRSKEETR